MPFPVQPLDLYDYDSKLENSSNRLDEDPKILNKNKETIKNSQPAEYHVDYHPRASSSIQTSS